MPISVERESIGKQKIHVAVGVEAAAEGDTLLRGYTTRSGTHLAEDAAARRPTA